MKQCPVCEAWCFEDMPVCYNCMYSFQRREHASETVGAQFNGCFHEKDPSESGFHVTDDANLEELFAELDEVDFDGSIQGPIGESGQALAEEPIEGLDQERSKELIRELDSEKQLGILRIEVPLDAIRAWAV